MQSQSLEGRECAPRVRVFQDILQADILVRINSMIDAEHARAGPTGPPGLAVSPDLATMTAELLRNIPDFYSIEQQAVASAQDLVQMLDDSVKPESPPIHIIRCVDRDIACESHCRHFDSHCLTLLIPLQSAAATDANGDLLIYRRQRTIPSTCTNVVTKVKHGIQRCLPLAWRRFLTQRDLRRERCDRVACVPGNVYAFNGFVTKHGNLDIEAGQRRSLLIHWYDPGRSAGISQALRTVRLMRDRVRLSVTGR